MTDDARVVRTDAPPASELLRLARRDRQAARARLREMSDVQQAEACRELRPEVRAELLGLLEHPERVVPLLPAAELVHTVRGGGMSEAAWLLELATPEQRRACFDLDCWQASRLEIARVTEWIDALIEAGRPTLLRALEEVDAELLLLTLRAQTDVVVVGKEDEPPDGHFTADGVVYWRVDDDASPHQVHEIAHAAFAEAPSAYWRLAYGMLFELPSELEEYALRWRTRRLNDLGFPEREDAMRVYRPLPPEKVEDFGSVEIGSDGLQPSFGVPRQLGGSRLAEALEEMDPARAADRVGEVLSVANWIAIADDLRLSEPGSIPRALRKAVAGIDRGLAELARLRGQPLGEVLSRTRVMDLFRVGATLEPELRLRGVSSD